MEENKEQEQEEKENKIKNRKEEELKSSTDESEDLGRNNNKNFFNRSMSAANLAGKAAGGLNRGLNNMARANGMEQEEQMPNTSEELKNMAGSGINTAKGINNFATGLKNGLSGNSKNPDELKNKNKNSNKENASDKKEGEKQEHKKEKTKAKVKEQMKKQTTDKAKKQSKKEALKVFLKTPVGKIALAVGIISLLLFVILLVVLMLLAEDAYGSSCSSEATEKDVLNFINTWEGSGGYCDDEKTQYKAYQNSGDRVTIGHGVTSDYINGLILGQCISVEEVDEAQMKSIDKKRNFVKGVMQKHNVTLTNYQEDALTSMAYNGCANYFDDIATSIATGDYSSIWDSMKGCTNSGLLGLERRRKAEFALYVTGDYSVANSYKTMSWTEEEYNDYDNEKVMARQDTGGGTCTGGDYIFPSKSKCPIGDCYGMRIHPIYMIFKMHNGVDISCNNESEIIAVADGEVITSSKDFSSTYGPGGYVQIKHDDGVVSGYMHLSAIYVEEGDQVTQGQTIGLEGSTGGSTGPHLHFEIVKQGAYQNPAEYIDLGGTCD